MQEMSKEETMRTEPQPSPQPQRSEEGEDVLEKAVERHAFDKGIAHTKRDEPAWHYSIIDFTAGAHWGLKRGRELERAEHAKAVDTHIREYEEMRARLAKRAETIAALRKALEKAQELYANDREREKVISEALNASAEGEG